MQQPSDKFFDTDGSLCGSDVFLANLRSPSRTIATDVVEDLEVRTAYKGVGAAYKTIVLAPGGVTDPRSKIYLSENADAASARHAEAIGG